MNEIDDKVNLVYVYCVIIRKLIFYEYRPEDWENAEIEFDEDGNVIENSVVKRRKPKSTTFERDKDGNVVVKKSSQQR